MRRKFRISQPSILKRLSEYNKGRSHEHRIKPFGFVQSITPALITSDEILPIAPFEADLAKSKRLPWVDYNTGAALHLDWNGSGIEGTIPVTRLSEYVNQYQRHPEAKAADWKGDPAELNTVGLLGRLRLRSNRLVRIGKEVDRLDQEDGASLEPDRPVEYERDELTAAIAYLADLPQEAVASELGLSVRGWRSLVKGVSKPRSTTAKRIRQLSTERSMLEH